MKVFSTFACATALLATTGFAQADTWTSVDDQSSVAFGSVKKDVVGEVHHFEKVSGTVNDAGEVAINIDLSSVQTNIDIRNERMIEHVFNAGQATAVLSGEVDMDGVNSMAVGATALVDFEGSLAFAGISADIEAEMLVARLSETSVLVTTADFIMLSTADLGIDGGVDKLMQLAKLPGITRVTPVSVRMVFTK